jgi:hypothetical protein
MTPNALPQTGLRRATPLVLAGGAIVAAALTLWVGLGSHAPVLIVPFELWVLAPFVALGWALSRAGAWSVQTQAALRWATLLVVCGSVAAYVSRVAWPLRVQGAFVFVAVPPLSLVLAAAIVAGWTVAGRRPGGETAGR